MRSWGGILVYGLPSTVPFPCVGSRVSYSYKGTPTGHQRETDGTPAGARDTGKPGWELMECSLQPHSTSDGVSVLATMPPTPPTSIDQVAKPISIDQMVKTTALTTWSSLGPILKDNGRASPFCRRIASLKIIGASELVVVVGGRLIGSAAGRAWLTGSSLLRVALRNPPLVFCPVFIVLALPVPSR